MTVGTFYVVSGNYGSLLSHQTAVELGLIQIQPKISVVQAKTNTLNQLLQEYQDIIQGIGRLQDFQFEIHIDSSVPPVAQSPRRIPFHIRKQVEQELQKLKNQGIIEKVDGPTPWSLQLLQHPSPTIQMK